MNLTIEQAAKVDAFVADLGDYFAQDRNDDAMHRCFAVIRHELAEETSPLGHPDLRDELDWIDSILDKIEARRKEVISIIAMRLQRMLNIV